MDAALGLVGGVEILHHLQFGADGGLCLTIDHAPIVGPAAKQRPPSPDKNS